MADFVLIPVFTRCVLCILQFVGTQCLAFAVGVAGAAVLLDYSTLNSSVQPIIRNSMRRLIELSSQTRPGTILKMIQENVSDLKWLRIRVCIAG